MQPLRSKKVFMTLFLAFYRFQSYKSFILHRSRFVFTRSLASNYQEPDDEIIKNTMKWVNKTIVGLNLCPFAEKSISQKELFTTVVRGDDTEEIMSYVLYESILRKDDTGTTLGKLKSHLIINHPQSITFLIYIDSLVICPELFPDNFLDYYDVVCALEEIIEDKGLDEDVQIAPFHPLFQFEGSEQDTIGDYTNRSPYPIFHILREVEVSRAVKKLDNDASKVWTRNIRLLEEMEKEYGRDETEKIIKGERELTQHEIKALLRRFGSSN